MDLQKNEDRYFRLTNFYAAAFLFSKGIELANIDRTTPKRAQFVFRDCLERETLMQSFNFSPENSSEVMVDARKLITAIKTLKEKLYQEEF